MNQLNVTILNNKGVTKKMNQLLTSIEDKVAQYNQLKEEINELDKELKADLKELDKNAFDGLSWYEYLRTINETINLSDDVEINRREYSLTGKMNLPNNVELTLSGVIYKDNLYYRPTIHYKDSNRVVSDFVPKKYEEQLNWLTAELDKYKVERPSDKYVKEAGLLSVF